MQALKGRLQATRIVFQDGVMPPGHPSLLRCVVTMNKNMEKHLFHSDPTEMAVDRGMLPHLLRLVKVGSVSMLAFRANFRKP
jgi:hypothetical protein